MKVGLIGTRHVHAEGLARLASEAGASVVAAVERDAEAAARWSLCPLVERDRLLADVDAVIVAGTNRERVDDVLACCRAGRPVLSEKPVSTDAAGLHSLLAAADPALVMVALPVRFSAAFQQAREAIRNGALGKPLAARGTNHGQFPGGWFGSLEEAGGGALQDHVVHLADVLCWLFDDRAVRAYARAERALHPQLDVEDCAVTTVDFESGMFASIDASWSRPRTFPTWGDVWLELVGTEGRILLDPMATRLELYDDGAGRLRHVPYGDDDMTRTMVERFLRFATEGGTSPVSLAEGIHASDIVQASYASVRSGRPEPVGVR